MPINEDMRLSDIDALQELLKRERVQLPNLMSLTTRGVPGLDDRTGILWNQLEALRGLSQLRRLFPETVDSIVDMDFFPKHDRKERLMNSARAIRLRSSWTTDLGYGAERPPSQHVAVRGEDSSGRIWKGSAARPPGAC
jgi:hypothetical protein